MPAVIRYMPTLNEIQASTYLSLISQIIPNVVTFSHFRPYFLKERKAKDGECDQILRLS
jgi:hypothetical protein